MSELVSVILAAGKGTRMKSKLPKVLHEVAGKAMLDHVLDASCVAGASKNIVVVGHHAELVTEHLAKRAEIVVQEELLGTGHAVMQAESVLSDFKGTVMILCGDTPLVDGKELKKFYDAHKEAGAVASVLTAITQNPTGYGRIIHDEKGLVCKIVEEKDASIKEKAIQEINTGIYCVEGPYLFKELHNLSCENSQKEYYLTDILANFKNQGVLVSSVVTADFDMIMGVNSRIQLATAEKIMRERTLEKFMDNGVTIIDPASTFINPSAKIGMDTIIRPFTYLEGEIEIGEGCEIGPNTRFTDVKVGNNCEISFTYAHECEIKNNVKIGPYVQIRPNTIISDNAKIGNFVEIKNSNVGAGTKLPHLSYIGDSDIGERVNMGCGCITVNYDGKEKHRTTIKDDAFIGCNSNLVAPVTINEGAYVGAGTTVTKEVEAGDLAVARAKQRNLKGWASKHKSK